MSATIPGTPVTSPASSSTSPVISGLLSTLKLVVGMAATPGGLSLATSILGTAAPEILLAEQFGVRLLGPLLTTWTTPTISDADLAAKLAGTGTKVPVFDPVAAFR